MGFSQSPGQLAAKFRMAATAMQRTETVGLQKAASFTKGVIQHEIEQVAPGRRMRGVGRNGARVGAGYKIFGSTATITARGPLHLLERSTKPHEITPKRRRRGKAKKAVTTPYGPRKRVMHPGTRGKHPWRKGVEKARPFVTKVFKEGFYAPIEDIFR